MSAYEYKTIETGRKSGTSHEDMWPDGDGWEIDSDKGRDGWERFDHHEELYFRRPIVPAEAADELATLTKTSRN